MFPVKKWRAKNALIIICALVPLLHISFVDGAVLRSVNGKYGPSLRWSDGDLHTHLNYHDKSSEEAATPENESQEPEKVPFEAASESNPLPEDNTVSVPASQKPVSGQNGLSISVGSELGSVGVGSALRPSLSSLPSLSTNSLGSLSASIGQASADGSLGQASTTLGILQSSSPNEVLQQLELGISHPDINDEENLGWAPGDMSHVPTLVLDSTLNNGASAVVYSSHNEHYHLIGTEEHPAISETYFGSESHFNVFGNTTQESSGTGVANQQSVGHIEGGSTQMYDIAMVGDHNEVTVDGASDAFGVGSVDQQSFSDTLHTPEYSQSPPIPPSSQESFPDTMNTIENSQIASVLQSPQESSPAVIPDIMNTSEDSVPQQSVLDVMNTPENSQTTFVLQTPQMSFPNVILDFTTTSEDSEASSAQPHTEESFVHTVNTPEMSQTPFVPQLPQESFPAVIPDTMNTSENSETSFDTHEQTPIPESPHQSIPDIMDTFEDSESLSVPQQSVLDVTNIPENSETTFVLQSPQQFLPESMDTFDDSETPSDAHFSQQSNSDIVEISENPQILSGQEAAQQSSPDVIQDIMNTSEDSETHTDPQQSFLDEPVQTPSVPQYSQESFSDIMQSSQEAFPDIADTSEPAQSLAVPQHSQESFPDIVQAHYTSYIQPASQSEESLPTIVLSAEYSQIPSASEFSYANNLADDGAPLQIQLESETISAQILENSPESQFEDIPAGEHYPEVDTEFAENISENPPIHHGSSEGGDDLESHSVVVTTASSTSSNKLPVSNKPQDMLNTIFAAKPVVPLDSTVADKIEAAIFANSNMPKAYNKENPDQNHEGPPQLQ